MLDDLMLSWRSGKQVLYNVSAFDKASNKGENIMCCCPYHEEESPSFGILTQYPYTFNCFGCGESGSLGKLIAHVMELPSEIHGLHYIQKHYIVLSVKDRKKLDIRSIIDGGNKLDRKRSLPESEVTKYTSKKHSYITSRGFSDRTLRKYEIGYDEQSNSITFPVRTSKGLVRFIKRRNVLTKSFLNEKNIYKKDILYGLYYLSQSPHKITEVFVNESETDTMSCYESGLPAVAILGRILFEEQLREFLLAGIKTVNLFFDNDKAGVDCTLKTYELLSKTPIKVNVVMYPGGHWGIDTVDTEELPYKDANDLLKSKMMKKIKVVPFLTFRSQVPNSVIEELKRPKLSK
jgi:DNA primase